MNLMAPRQMAKRRLLAHASSAISAFNASSILRLVFVISAPAISEQIVSNLTNGPIFRAASGAQFPTTRTFRLIPSRPNSSNVFP